ncbi:hypothetical protein ACL6C3_30970 [Capilliphycus salinus ALCB114379]|uniref:hypothetical protein n=1 Tax=Capilliphycus salinus TaxID=2768948 RepID=UPI0039A5CD21
MPTVYLKYPVLGLRGLSGKVSSILKSDNQRPTGLRWKKYATRYKFNFWETRCNGITIDVAPFDGLVFVLERTKIQKLLEVEMLCLKDPEFTEIVQLWPFIEQQPPGLSILEQDPIPQLWTKSV